MLLLLMMHANMNDTKMNMKEYEYDIFAALPSTMKPLVILFIIKQFFRMDIFQYKQKK